MTLLVVSDTHWNEKDGSPMRTHCLRPENYTQLSLKRWRERVRPTDTVIHCGDVINGPKREVKAILESLPGRKIHVRGNHDRDKSCGWWMENGMDLSVDSFAFRGVLFTHEPANAIVKSNGNDRAKVFYKWCPDCYAVTRHIRVPSGLKWTPSGMEEICDGEID